MAGLIHGELSQSVASFATAFVTSAVPPVQRIATFSDLAEEPSLDIGPIVVGLIGAFVSCPDSDTLGSSCQRNDFFLAGGEFESGWFG